MRIILIKSLIKVFFPGVENVVIAWTNKSSK